MPFEIIIIVSLIIVAIILAVVYFRKYGSHTIQPRSLVDRVTIGMTEHEMISIMGENYTKSLLKNSRIKYEYLFQNAHSVGSYCFGINSRKYYGAAKAVIYCKNGYVEEVKSYNI